MVIRITAGERRNQERGQPPAFGPNVRVMSERLWAVFS